MDYLRDAPLYDTVQVNDKKYILVHAGLGNFYPERKLSDYRPDELLWARPTLETKYFDDANKIVVFGHTPTEYFGEQYRGKVLKTDNLICVNTGEKTMLLRLDDMAEFYLNK